MIVFLALGTGLAGAVCANLSAPLCADWKGMQGASLKQRLRALADELPDRGRRAAGLAVVGLVMTGGGAVAYAAQPATPAPAVHSPAVMAAGLSTPQNSQRAAPRPAVRPAAPAKSQAQEPAGTDAEVPPTVVEVLPSLLAPRITLNTCPSVASAEPAAGPGASPTCRDPATGEMVQATPVSYPVQGASGAAYISTKVCISVRSGQIATLAREEGPPGSGIARGACYDSVTMQPIELTVVNYGLPPGMVAQASTTGAVSAAPAAPAAATSTR
ncbi:MAG: hypothetical protein JWM33_2037 [Caulobacteraceae bacterium]|nr:hypothetical protein [Caulobacteraceae bacterium]